MYKSPADYRLAVSSGPTSNIFVLDEASRAEYLGSNRYTTMVSLMAAASLVPGPKIIYFTDDYDMEPGTYDFSDFDFISLAEETITLYIGSYDPLWIVTLTGMPRSFQDFFQIELCPTENSIYVGPACDFEINNCFLAITDDVFPAIRFTSGDTTIKMKKAAGLGNFSGPALEVVSSQEINLLIYDTSYTGENVFIGDAGSTLNITYFAVTGGEYEIPQPAFLGTINLELSKPLTNALSYDTSLSNMPYAITPTGNAAKTPSLAESLATAATLRAGCKGGVIPSASGLTTYGNFGTLVTGTIASTGLDSGGRYTVHTASAATENGWNKSIAVLNAATRYFIAIRFRLLDLTDVRFFAGLTSPTGFRAKTTVSDSPTYATLTAMHIGVQFFSSRGDTTFKLWISGTSSFTVTDTLVVPNVNTDYTVTISSLNSATVQTLTLYDGNFDTPLYTKTASGSASPANNSAVPCISILPLSGSKSFRTYHCQYWYGGYAL